MSDPVDELLETGDTSVTDHGRGDAVDQLLENGVSAVSKEPSVAAPESNGDRTDGRGRLSVVARNPTMGRIDTNSRASASDVVQAAASGANSTVLDIAGLPMDTATNASNLLKSGAEAGLLKLGVTPPTWLDPDRPERVPGTSDWLKWKTRAAGQSNLIDTTNRSGEDLSALHSVGETLGPAPLAEAAASTRQAVSRAAKNLFGTNEWRPPARVEPTLNSGPTSPSAQGSQQANTVAPELTATDIPRTPPSPTPPASPAPNLSATGSPSAAYWEPANGDKAPTFAQEAPTAPKGSTLPPKEQAQREAILKRVGVPETRLSALEGDAQTAADEYQQSKLNSPIGERFRQVLEGERTALSNHADRLVESTGGTPGSAADESTRVERGNNILTPLDDLAKYFDDATSQLYAEATRRARGQPPSQLSRFHELLNDDSEMTNSDRVNLRTGLNAYLNKLKLVQEDGSVAANPEQAETVRKYLNENWSPQNSKYVGKLKDAIDDDVTKAAGTDIYGRARQMRTLRARTLDDPDGISKLMDSSGPQGINRAVPVEKVADTLTSMPVAQLQHIVTTLRNMPEELQPQAQAALAEIRAHMASKVADAGKTNAGSWNAKGVSQALTKNSARMKVLYTPEELASFGDLNDAGNILKKDQSYPGAAVQQHNLVRSGAMMGVRAGGAGLGGIVGGAFGAPVTGAAAGGALADMAGKRFSEARALKNANKRIVDLSR